MRTTVADILAEEGIAPAPEQEKKRTWEQFMKSHWDTLYACDFFSVEAFHRKADCLIDHHRRGLGAQSVFTAKTISSSRGLGRIVMMTWSMLIPGPPWPSKCLSA